MADVPIIGQNEDAKENSRPLAVGEIAFLGVLDPENGRWVALKWDTPLDVFRECSPEDVINGCRRIVDNLLTEEAVTRQVQTSLALASQMQQQAQERAIRANLNLGKNQ